jgi:hypothetical protein
MVSVAGISTLVQALEEPRIRRSRPAAVVRHIVGRPANCEVDACQKSGSKLANEIWLCPAPGTG